ncbi:hypothetical protein B0T17DRAFT_538441 [Bombardia bombarda]|uniref:proline--tRNA ligase n=1 Tax=Bombardia bombarda TaxID=252184 RepID=A0AA39WNE2_9PEZI|nr:hypothetical protein B0T17DRAFT_538441 [Bombardia bombarda]
MRLPVGSRLPVVPRLSRVWVPSSGGIAAPGAEDAHAKLIRAGFLRPSHSGIFHMLPLGRRVQDKIERLVARHMEESLAASRVSLSSISAESLWEKSGRLQNVGSELFRFSDRKDVPYLLSPTHEEEITSLVARTVLSYKELPLRLYQITRKYRDEFRPRHGLLRGREFTMKDLYTFDTNIKSALETYDQVRAAYTKIFEELNLPVLAAKASSGDMGGDLSHEYLLPTKLGEDRVVSCDSCDYVINEEIAETPAIDKVTADTLYAVWRGITKDRSTLVNVWYPVRDAQLNSRGMGDYTDLDINIAAVKSVVPDLDAGIDNPLPLWSTAINGPEQTATGLVNVVDGRLPITFSDSLESSQPTVSVWPEELIRPSTSFPPVLVHRGMTPAGKVLNLLRIRSGDTCPQCSSGTLKAEKAIELGHTFHLGTRYSEPLEARVRVPASPNSVAMQMGCHGIGISRIIGALAEHMADNKGLNWPVSIAPYSCVIITGKDVDPGDAIDVYRQIMDTTKAVSERVDPVVDDRKESLPWKLKDADLIGFPIMVLLGREWRTSRRAEIQCRRLGIRDSVREVDLPDAVRRMHGIL